jgi:hypothetical protein
LEALQGIYNDRKLVNSSHLAEVILSGVKSVITVVAQNRPYFKDGFRIVKLTLLGILCKMPSYFGAFGTIGLECSFILLAQTMQVAETNMWRLASTVVPTSPSWQVIWDHNFINDLHLNGSDNYHHLEGPALVHSYPHGRAAEPSFGQLLNAIILDATPYYIR